jgi:hypothetical protein
MGKLLLSLVFAAVFTLIFAVFLGRKGPWVSTGVFFLVLFFATLGVGKFMRHVGPTIFGLYWLPFAMISLLISLLLAAALPARPRRIADEVPAGSPERREAIALDSFFWIFLVALIVLIVAGYVVPEVGI